jgi:hypothetical protein
MPVSNSRDTILIERRYAAVFGTITDESIVALAGGVEEKLRDALAKVLALPAGAFAESATLAQKVGLGLCLSSTEHRNGTQCLCAQCAAR